MNKLYYLLFILYVLLLTFKSNGSFPSEVKHGNFFPYIIDKPYTEDGFYMLTIAWNIAEGKGITYTLNRPTTGTQPLVTLIQAGIAKVVILFSGNKIDFLRAMIIFSSLLIFLFSIVTGGIAEKLLPGYNANLIVPLLTLFSFDFFAYFNNGLETGFYLLQIAVIIYYSLHFVEYPGYKRAFIMGIIAGVTLLTRIDFAVPLFVFLILLYIYKKIEIKKIFLILIIAGVFLIPWLVYVFNVSGSIFPASASRQITFVTSSGFSGRLYNIVLSFTQHLTPFFYTNNFYFCLSFTIINGVIFYFINKRYKYFREVNNNSLIIISWWGLSFITLAVIYLLFSTNTYFYIRYTTPLYVVIFLTAASAIIFSLQKIPGVYRKTFIPLLVLLFLAQVYYYHFDSKISNLLSLRINFIQKNFNEYERIGMGQSGVTGFFINNIVNLDGKVDHVISLYAANNNIEGFLDSMNVNVLIEWDNSFSHDFRKNYLEKKWEFLKKDIGDGRTVCYVRK
jgi:hypothetical protein